MEPDGPDSPESAHCQARPFYGEEGDAHGSKICIPPLPRVTPGPGSAWRCCLGFSYAAEHGSEASDYY